MERHQSCSHLRGHGGPRNAFHFHPGRVMMRHIVICDSGLFSPLSFSYCVVFFHIPSSYLLLSSSQSRTLHHICRGGTKHFPDGIQPSSHLSRTLFICLSPRPGQRKRSIFICPQLLSFVLAACLSENIRLSLPTCLFFISSIHRFFPPPCGCQFSCLFFTDMTHN